MALIHPPSCSQATIERSPPRGSDLDQSLPTLLFIADVARTENLPGTRRQVLTNLGSAGARAVSRELRRTESTQDRDATKGSTIGWLPSPHVPSNSQSQPKRREAVIGTDHLGDREAEATDLVR
jgi:hypothetical protein